VTTIAGIQHDWGCTILTDGVSTGSDYRVHNDPGIPKVVQRAEYLIAPAGATFACDAVMYGWNPPPFVGKEPLREIVASVVPSMRSHLSSVGYEMDGKHESPMVALIAVHGVIYQIDTDGSVVLNRHGIYGIGTGGAYAVGALMAGANENDALLIACENDVYTGAPGHIQHQRKPGWSTDDRDATDSSDADAA